MSVLIWATGHQIFKLFCWFCAKRMKRCALTWLETSQCKQQRAWQKRGCCASSSSFPLLYHCPYVKSLFSSLLTSLHLFPPLPLLKSSQNLQWTTLHTFYTCSTPPSESFCKGGKLVHQSSRQKRNPSIWWFSMRCESTRQDLSESQAARTAGARQTNQPGAAGLGMKPTRSSRNSGCRLLGVLGALRCDGSSFEVDLVLLAPSCWALCWV